MAGEPETDAEALAFRRRLVDEGVVDELLPLLVALGETKAPVDAPIGFIAQNFGQGMFPPLEERRYPGMHVTSHEMVEENQRLKARVAELQVELKAANDELKRRIPEGTLTVFGIAAYNVPDVDVMGGLSDPFVRVSLLDAKLETEDDDVELGRAMDPIAFRDYCERHKIAAQTSIVQNCVNPSWPDEVLEIVLPAGTPRPPRVLVRVWDDDVAKSDDPIASLEVQLQPLAGKFEKLALKGRGNLPDVLIDFEYKMIEPEEETRTAGATRKAVKLA